MTDSITGIVAEMDAVIGMGLETAPDSLRNLRDRIAALAAPAGCVVVPREPTQAMQDAGVDAAVHGAKGRPWFPIAWAAALAAAPAVSGASRESRMTVIERDATGGAVVWCDPEIADLVTALNAAGIRTVASCSGHGERFGSIALKDGRELLIAPSYDEARRAEQVITTPATVSDPAPAVTGEVGRYTHGRSNYRMTPAIDGPFVRYTDHARIVAAKDAFKAYVHRRLDAMGVPHTVPSPHTDAGCRIGGRLDWIEQRAEALAGQINRALAILGPSVPASVTDEGARWEWTAALGTLTGQATPEGA